MALSVSAAGNYLSNTKRLFEESSEAGSPFGAQQPTKRVRLLGSPPLFGRCNPAAADCFAPFQASSSAVAALLSLFPDMEEQAVIAVLSDCGDNIDAAIKRLSQLRLNNSSSRQAKEAQEQAVADHGQQAQAAASTSGTSGEAQSGDWVELLVQEMAAAKDMADARVRAARLLAIFSKHVAEQGTNSGLLEKLQELNKENHILKRAVQIQNSKLQERSQQEQEIQQLRVMLGQYQEQVRTLELNNYSLVLHLQKATNGSAMAHGHHHPDVC